MPIIVNDCDKFLTLTHLSELNQLAKIPPMVYSPGFLPTGTPILAKLHEQFKVPAKTYGNHDMYMAAITTHFEKNREPTGVILSGLKGSGKTMLAESLCNYVIKTKKPILQITSPMPADTIKMFIKIVGPCVVLFDEFGKVYHEELVRKQMLTLFSDSTIENVMFIVTANGYHELDEYMIDRPGRFQFRIDYEGMGEEAIGSMMEEIPMTASVRQYVEDYTTYNQISFDMLKAFMALLREHKTVDAIVDASKITNIPRPVTASYHIREITYKNEEYLGLATMDNEKDGTTTFRMLEKKDGSTIEEFTFDWLTVDRKRLDKKDTQYLLVLRKDLTVKVRRQVMPIYFADKTNKFDGSKNKTAKHAGDPHYGHDGDEGNWPPQPFNNGPRY